VQAAVDTKNHLIVAHEVTNVGHDRGQLSKMAQDVTGHDALTVIADRDYLKGEDILASEQGGLTPYVPKPLTSGAKAAGCFGKQDFVYVAEDNTYRCPAGESLTWPFSSVEHEMVLHSYWTTPCESCALKMRCTTGQQRRIKRWEHEAVLDAMQHRLDQAPDIMRIRRQTVEHPFGTLKAWMGATHFLTRTIKRVSTEIRALSP
jgi:transposase